MELEKKLLSMSQSKRSDTLERINYCRAFVEPMKFEGSTFNFTKIALVPLFRVFAIDVSRKMESFTNCTYIYLSTLSNQSSN